MKQRPAHLFRKGRGFPFHWAAACAAFILGSAFALTSLAAGLVATLPHVLFRGPPAGPSAMPGGDWARANRSGPLSNARALEVIWRRRVTGGISCNVLVDDEGRIFVAGSGNVTELGFDGRVTYRKGANAECLAAALLADGSRVVLSTEGRLSAWSARGAPRFDLMLDAPVRFSRATLLSLPDGGVLCSLGGRIFDVGPAGALRAHVSSSHDVVQSVVAGNHVLLIDSLGEISEWDGPSLLRRRGSFGMSVGAVAASDPSTLIGLGGRVALAFSLKDDQPRPYFAFDNSGAVPSISVPIEGHPIFLRADGVVERPSARDVPSLPASRLGAALDTLRDVQLLSSSEAVAWLAANLPLEILAGSDAPRWLPEVVCPQPVSLAAAPRQHLVIGCKTGQIWLVGPAAQPGPSSVRPD